MKQQDAHPWLVRGTATHIPLSDESVQCCVTSPPYYSLREYAGEQLQTWGGDPAHEHCFAPYALGEGYSGRTRWQHSVNGKGEVQSDPITRRTHPEVWQQYGANSTLDGGTATQLDAAVAKHNADQGGACECGAWRGALGLEPVPDCGAWALAFGAPVAFVSQDGMSDEDVPWRDIDALFVGGTSEWKTGHESGALISAAHARGKWVHMGRVNTARRLHAAVTLGCDSVDGNFLAPAPDENWRRLRRWLDAPQQAMVLR